MYQSSKAQLKCWIDNGDDKGVFNDLSFVISKWSNLTTDVKILFSSASWLCFIGLIEQTFVVKKMTFQPAYHRSTRYKWTLSFTLANGRVLDSEIPEI